MPYVKTGRPNGRPRKVAPVVEAESKPTFRRVRKEFEPAPKRRFVALHAPAPYQAPADLTPPSFGQRVRIKQRGPSLNPLPVKA